MTRLEVVTELVRLSGHVELVKNKKAGDYSDNGANFHINAGQKWLDRNFPYKKAKAWLYKSLSAGESLVTFAKARYISEVWTATAAGRRQLNVSTQRGYRNAESCASPFWSPVIVGLSPDHDGEDAEDFAAAGVVDYANIQFGNSYLTDAIAIYPAVSETTTVQVLAHWYSRELSDDTDVSFWSENEPDMLIRAARMDIERQLHRNADGAKAFADDLLLDLQNLYHALVTEEMSGPPEHYRMFGRYPEE